MLAESDVSHRDISFFRFRRHAAESSLQVLCYSKEVGRLNDVRESFLVFCRSSKLMSVVVCLIVAVLGILLELSFCRVEALVFERVSCRCSRRLVGLHVDDRVRGCDLSLCLALISSVRHVEAKSHTQDPHRCL